MEYALLRLIHVGTVYITFGLFVTRGIWMLLDSPRLQDRWVKVVPHLNDTLLFVAAIGMLIAGGLNPLVHPWLLVKIFGLLLYIYLGAMALKRGRTKGQRTIYFIAALATIGYIIAVAVTKQVIPGVI
ncbi:MAG: regulator SirB [Hydrogenophilales bacterium CG03_land_8_20_14_0_80_62_28]|nr:SirB2 family protein [Betaproteobacteria bacterium]OIO77518.1 MAG: regulator SirB [Hydrogenophilaceae bacterium CG1_02_62_390]PIV22919.1 MAG: regulator SirB [Hydrogenophilales bacterium CG03_land_8_20_14_0_80_62_28]PIW38029.1 MAG: regulator SirB [Hydrogenophilales bacterium CG15_BIG_FIL_POST_REV_8_21_14_020_62_31]PIW70844.1 MAG: regulator SirB [Hydrogenophilales bacterium CG12_big_fil_rev_8_21_14_0_65_61_21]PIX00544.1 MAG: regulator SirB [Hydrogenophilales bacterium CG_4_8_14_3_um_filter_62